MAAKPKGGFMIATHIYQQDDYDNTTAPTNGYGIVWNSTTSLWNPSSGVVETTNHRNVANGYAGLDSNGDFIGTIVFRNDIASNLSAVVLLAAEAGYATDTYKFTVGDGSTVFASLAGISFQGNAVGILGNGIVYSGTTGASSASASGAACGAFGGLNTVTGPDSFAFGTFNNIDSGSANFAAGTSNVAYGECCIALGNTSIAVGLNTYAEQGGTSYGRASHAESVSIAGASNSHSEGGGQTGILPDSCTISGTTLTIAGLDATGRYANGDHLNLFNSTAAYALSAHVNSVPAYSGGNTTFTLAGGTAGGYTSVVNIDYAAYSHAGGFSGATSKISQWARGSAVFANPGDCQQTFTYLSATTTDATQTELTIDGTGSPSGTVEGTSNRYVLAAGKSYGITLTINAQVSGSATGAMLVRCFRVINIGGTLTLGSITSVMTDNSPSYGLTIQTDSTHKSLQVLVTGVASTTIGWNAVVEAVEVMI